jgi:hypothetical protein
MITLVPADTTLPKVVVKGDELIKLVHEWMFNRAQVNAVMPFFLNGQGDDMVISKIMQVSVKLNASMIVEGIFTNDHYLKTSWVVEM